MPKLPTYKKASLKFCVPTTTLRDRIKRFKQGSLELSSCGVKKFVNFKSVFTHEQERELAKHLIFLKSFVSGYNDRFAKNAKTVAKIVETKNACTICKLITKSADRLSCNTCKKKCSTQSVPPTISMRSCLTMGAQPFFFPSYNYYYYK